MRSKVRFDFLDLLRLNLGAATIGGGVAGLTFGRLRRPGLFLLN
jgi:hypothetical protein